MTKINDLMTATTATESYKQVQIKDIYLALYDGPHATPKPASEGAVFLGIKNITEDGKLDLSEIRYISEEDFPKWTRRVLPRSGDIVFTYEATLNRYAIIPEGFRGCLGRRLALIRPNPEKVDTRFLLYYFFGEEWRKTIATNLIFGSTVDRIPLTNFPKFEVSLPPLSTQRKIAGILSAYDDLIENNTRRIEILEEMARSLFREWFVKFRFPGHEQVKMVDSDLGLIPEGWEVISLGQILDIKHGYAFKGEYFSKEPTSDILLTPGNFKFGGGFKDDKFKYYKGLVSDEFVLSTSDLLVTMTDLSKEGDTLGYPAFVPPSKELRFLHNQRLGKIILHNPQLGLNHLYHIFCSDSYRHHVLASATGATVKHTAPDRIKSFSIALPSQEISNKFETITSSFSRKIILLNQKKQNLRQTRDLLLPKLISGEIDVEKIDIGVYDAQNN